MTPFTGPPAPRRGARLREALERTLWRTRFVLAALCAGLAAAVLVATAAPAPPPTVRVVVTARDVDAGSRLAARDVRTVTVAAALAPAGTLRDADDAVGRTPAVGLPAGSVLSPALLAGDGVAASAPTGRVVVALPLDDAALLTLASAGDRVDLLTATGKVAERALVLPVAAADATGGLLPDRGAAPATLVVAVEPGEAARIAALTDGDRVLPVLVR